ncbi:MAG: DUF2442 domain-containing protein [Deltaproteobacteria bacterium]|nr:DUF2442 domain-containing protein [Deltaproteobacteria bacterium]
MKKHHDIRDVHFEGDVLVITIDGKTNRFPLGAVSPLLLKASARERQSFEISPSGYGIHWSLLDEDISIDGLLGIPHAPKEIRRTRRHASASETFLPADSQA